MGHTTMQHVTQVIAKTQTVAGNATGLLAMHNQVSRVHKQQTLLLAGRTVIGGVNAWQATCVAHDGKPATLLGM
jgi:hypothetical protein